MIAFNHALTGSLIGLAMQRPLLALPIALGSHFICDAIPHYGSRRANDSYLQTNRFNVLLILDALLCVGLVAVLAVSSPAGWLLAAVCAFVATVPDFAWLPGYVRVQHGRAFVAARRNWFMNFAARIQWFEKPIGGLVEVFWAIGVSLLLLAYL